MAIAQDAAAPISRGPFSPAAPAVGLSGLFDILLRQVWVILAVFAAVLALAVVFLLTSTPKYTAAVELLLDPRDQRILPNEITQPGAGSDAALVESQLTVLTSDAVLGRTVDQLKLSANEEWVRGADIASFEATNASRGLERAAISRLIAIDALRKAVTVRRAERTYVIEVRVTSKDATLARAIADSIAGNYVTDQTDALKQRNMQTNQAVTARLDTLRADLKRAEEKLQAFRETNDLVGAQGTVIIDQQLQELAVRITQAQARTAEASSRATRLAAIARAGGIENTPDALTSQVLIALKGQLADARRRVAELYPTLGDNHPTLIEARSQAAQINGLIHKEAERIAAAAKAEADVARAQEAALSRELEEAKKKGQGVDAALIGQRDLERDVQAARQVYEALLNRAKETREQSEIEASSARVLAPAALLSRSPSPSRTLILALGIIGGLGLGTILALLRAHAANAVTGPQHMRDLTGVSVMTVNTGRLTGRSIFGKPTT
ncbi:MAG TPA: hypothetical protein DCL48_13150, partial [Alphaproteobacteria bacterium]|nr:hypothetical protein [Alphaproteobacteria bacterium]